MHMGYADPDLRGPTPTPAGITTPLVRNIAGIIPGMRQWRFNKVLDSHIRVAGNVFPLNPPSEAGPVTPPQTVPPRRE